jgi:glycosyltransferase involved in cell wall biosynthesis
LRIGFVSIQDATDVATWSGTPFHMLTQMRAQHVDVEVLSPLRTRAKLALAPLKLISRARDESVTLDHFPLVLRAYARQIESFVRKRSIDVVFSPSTIPVTLLRCGKPIVTWTDAVFHAMVDYYGKAFAHMTPAAVARGKWQEETALRNCAVAVFGSTWALEGAARLTDAGKLRVLPFGSSLPMRHTAADVARFAAEKRSIRKNQCELLFVGVNWERKGGAIAVETARLLNDAGIQTRLRVVGSQPEGEIPPFVDVVGFLNKNSESGERKLIELYRGADFLILPTKAEAAGIVFCEASSFGLPSLTCATGGVPDYVRNGVNGVCFAPGSSAADFAREIKRLLQDPSEYEDLALRAFHEYQSRLNWPSSVRRLIDLCSQCARA